MIILMLPCLIISVLISLKKKNWFTDLNLWTIMYVYGAFVFFGKCLKHMALKQHEGE